MITKVILISPSFHAVPTENTKLTANGGQTFRDETEHLREMMNRRTKRKKARASENDKLARTMRTEAEEKDGNLYGTICGIESERWPR